MQRRAGATTALLNFIRRQKSASLICSRAHKPRGPDAAWEWRVRTSKRAFVLLLMDANGASGGVLRVGVPTLNNARGKG